VQVGAAAKIALETLPDQELNGVVSFINPVGQTVGGLVKYTVRVDLSNVPSGLLLGTTTDVTIQAGEAQTVLVVPVDAVQNDAEGEYVLKVGDSDQPVRVNVRSGALIGDQVVVSGELQIGDRLLLNVPALEDAPGGMMMGR
jgi:multidrug efflux pump subunit AcrA (membrane-fusion protein)